MALVQVASNCDPRDPFFLDRSRDISLSLQLPMDFKGYLHHTLVDVGTPAIPGARYKLR
jgi:hypothetical protein